MASNKRKQDEKHLKMLRELVSLPGNKQCFDCHQRGPTYVNMTIGSFVCTSCSGILRGLNPPHRVKSISMASFTPEEMEVVKSHGNELNRKVYLGLYDSRSWPEPDSRDEQRVRDYMVQKYENKRWYVAPTDAMKEEARRANEAAVNNKPQVKPLRALLGENAPKVPVAGTQNVSTSQTHTQVTVPQPSSFKAPPTSQGTAPTAPAAKTASSGFDLLGDLGGDPFASSVPAQTRNDNLGGGFADFSNFSNMSSAPAPAPAPASVAAAPSAFPPMSGAPLQPIGSIAPTPTCTPSSTPTAPTSTTSFSAISDKYAALADLDSAFTSPTTTATAINWGGVEGGSINWGGANSTAAASVAPSQAVSSVGWSGASSGSGSINWNSPNQAGISMGSTPPSSGFGTTSAANPFGVPANQSIPSFSSAGAVSTQNPFGGTAVPSSVGMNQFSQAGAPGMPVSSGTGFGPQFSGMNQQQAGFGQFPVQNGAYAMPTMPASSGNAPFGGNAFPQQQFMMQQLGPSAGQPAVWGQVPGQQAATGAPPMANPFMNAAMQQHQVPPPSGSTNPFL